MFQRKASGIRETFVRDRTIGSPASWQIPQLFGCNYPLERTFWARGKAKKAEEKNPKDVHDVRIGKRMAREGRGSRRKHSWPCVLG